MGKKYLFVTEMDGGSLIGTGHYHRTIGLINYLIGNDKTINIELYVLFNGVLNIEIGRVKIYTMTSFKNLFEHESENYNIYDIGYCDLISKSLNDETVFDLRFISKKTIIISDSMKVPKYEFDQFILTHPIHFNKKKSDKHLTGLTISYTSSEFYDNAKKMQKNVKNVVISFGGVDPFDVTSLAVNLVNQNSSGKKIYVLVGRYYKGREKLKNISAINGNSIQILQNIPDVISLFRVADVAITAGGNSLYEFMALAVPCFTIAQNAKQNARCGILDDNGLVLHIGNYDCINSKIKIINDIKTLSSVNSKLLAINCEQNLNKVSLLFRE
jgi:spore coat polysaccharide biosynthesis predicted glycosyltransferase SpsG